MKGATFEFGLMPSSNPLITNRQPWASPGERLAIYSRALVTSEIIQRVCVHGMLKHLNGLTAMEVTVVPDPSAMVITVEVIMPPGHEREAFDIVEFAREAIMAELHAAGCDPSDETPKDNLQ